MNKNITLIALLFSISLASFAQVGIGTTSPDASSALEVNATDKGFLTPRMTTVQRNAIVNPAIGLLVYDTDTFSFWSFNGMSWLKESSGKFIDGADPTNAVYTDGNVAIGANNTLHRLQVTRALTTDEANTGIRVDATYNGTGTNAWTYGLDAVVRNSGTGTVSFAIGTQGRIVNDASGTMNTAVGSWPQINNSGNMIFGAGFFTSVNNLGTMTIAEGFEAQIFNDTGRQIDEVFMNYLRMFNNGTVNKMYGSYIEYQGTGTVTDSYAIYINDTFNNGTNDNFAIYSASDADSYLEGNVGVGTTTPQQKIHISGAMRLEPQATAPATAALGDLYVNTDGNLYFFDGTLWRAVQLI